MRANELDGLQLCPEKLCRNKFRNYSLLPLVVDADEQSGFVRRIESVVGALKVLGLELEDFLTIHDFVHII